MPDAAQVEQFNTQGYLLVRDVFTPAETEEFRAACKEGGAGDILGIPAFKQLPLDDRLLAIARALLGDPIVYFGYSNARSGDQSSPEDRHFHVDARRDDHDYGRPYPIIRMGIYLQDHDRSATD